MTAEAFFAIKFKERFPKGLPDSPGKLRIEVRDLNPDYAIGVKKESLQILAPPGNFDLNFFKGLLLLSFELILMVVVTVMGSTFLSSVVTITLALFVYIAGHMGEFLNTVLRTMATTGQAMASHPHGPMRAEEQSRWVMELFRFFLHWFTKLFPDLRRFDVSASLVIKGGDIPLSLLANSFIYMSLYVVIALIIAHLFLRAKEFR